MFLTNVLNPVGSQEPDLPSMKCDALPMSIVIPRTSTRDRAQFIAGHLDGTIKMYTARPASEWWKPETYDEGDVDFYDEEDEDAELSDEDEVAEDAFETSWCIKQSLLPVRALDLFPNNDNIMACATREGAVGIIDLETHKSILTHLDHDCGYSTLKAWDNNMVICGDEEGGCVGLDLRMGNATAFNVVMPSAPKNDKNGAKGNKIQPSKKNNNNTSTAKITNNQPALTTKWSNDDFGDYITSMVTSTKHNQVIFASSDKHVSNYDVRTGKYIDTGKNFDEMNSVCLLKDDELILTGSDTGPLSTFPINNLELMKDRYLFQDKSVDFMVPLDDDTILTATEDGIVRLLTINPTRIIGVVAVHKSWITAIASQRGPLEQDDFVWANDLVCVASADGVVRFWDVHDMQIVRQNLTKQEKKQLDKKRALDYEDSDDDSKKKKGKNKKQKENATKKKNVSSKSTKQSSIDSDDDFDWESDEDDDLYEAAGVKKPTKKAAPQKKATKLDKNAPTVAKPPHWKDSDDDSEYSSDDDDFDLDNDDAMKAFNELMVDYQVDKFAEDQERLRKKYLKGVVDPHANIPVNDGVDDGNDNDDGDDDGDDTSDFDWDNPGDSSDDFENDGDDEEDDDDDDEDVEGIDYELLDKMTEEEQDEYMKKFLGDFGSDDDDDGMSDEFDDSDDDGEMDFGAIKNLRKDETKPKKLDGVNKSTTPAIIDGKKKQNTKTTLDSNKDIKTTKSDITNVKTATEKVNVTSGQKDKKNTKNEGNKKTDEKTSQDKPLLPPPGPRIVPTILDATRFDHKQFRKAHGHELADANKSGFYADKMKKRKDKKAMQRGEVVEKPKSINGLSELPDIQHKLPTVRKLKHGTSNFFNGLK